MPTPYYESQDCMATNNNELDQGTPWTGEAN